MKVSDEKWNEIVNEVKAGIARWNAKASELKTGDTFRWVLKKNGLYLGCTTLTTLHDFGTQMQESGDAKIVAREDSTGEIRKVKSVWIEGRYAGTVANHKDPKSWSSLTEKPASEIVEKLKLLDFFIETQPAQQEA